MRGVLLFVGLLGGCGGAPPPDVSPATLALGGPLTGDAAGFAPFTDGEPVTLVAGAQGGFHVWLSYRLEGAAPGDVELTRSAHRVSDGALVLRSTGVVELGAPDADGVFQSPAPLPMFMCPVPVGLSIVDQPIRLELDFAAGGAPLAGRSVTVVPRCPDGERDLCERICTS